MSEFKREVRYTVIKHNQLTESQMQYLKNCIFGEGIPTVEAVVVESDWPEYQPVWKMIEDRVSGAPVDGGKAEYDTLAQSMTTNQTIDGVPLLPCPFCGGEPYGTHDHYVHDDLSPMPCVECRSCSAHLKVEDWNRRVQPAAQPQGEPVAWRYKKSWEKIGWVICDKHPTDYGIDEDCYTIQTLYAAQPEPVEVVMPERRAVSPSSREQAMCANTWNACLDEVARLNTK